MTTTFAVTLHKAIANKEVVCNFKGIALGDSWISPIDSVASWGQYLYSLVLFLKLVLLIELMIFNSSHSSLQTRKSKSIKKPNRSGMRSGEAKDR